VVDVGRISFPVRDVGLRSTPANTSLIKTNIKTLQSKQLNNKETLHELKHSTNVVTAALPKICLVNTLETTAEGLVEFSRTPPTLYEGFLQAH